MTILTEDNIIEEIIKGLKKLEYFEKEEYYNKIIVYLNPNDLHKYWNKMRRNFLEVNKELPIDYCNPDYILGYRIYFNSELEEHTISITE